MTLDGKFAYLFPCDAEYVLKFDMESDECQLVGPHLTEGENKFQNGFVGRDGCIYGCPQRASGVLRIIPPGVKRYDVNGSLSLSVSLFSKHLKEDSHFFCGSRYCSRLFCISSGKL